MKEKKTKISNSTIRDSFILDTIKQLKSGMKCYVFKYEQAKKIKQIYEDETKIKVFIEKENYYFILTPLRKFYKKGIKY